MTVSLGFLSWILRRRWYCLAAFDSAYSRVLSENYLAMELQMDLSSLTLEDMGKYSVIGKGKFGEVYKVNDKIALKWVKCGDIEESPEANRLFEDSKMEIIVLSTLSPNENIVKYFNSYVDQITLTKVNVLISMELLKASTLYDLFEKHNFKSYTFDMRVSILKQIHSGLLHIHAAGYVHMDICLNNIMFEHATGRAVIVDFGFTKYSSNDMRPKVTMASKSSKQERRFGYSRLHGTRKLFSSPLVRTKQDK